MLKHLVTLRNVSKHSVPKIRVIGKFLLKRLTFNDDLPVPVSAVF